MPTSSQRPLARASAGTLLAFSDVSWTLRKGVDSFGPAHLPTRQRLRRAVLIAAGLMLIGYPAVIRTASEAASVGGLLAEPASSAVGRWWAQVQSDAFDRCCRKSLFRAEYENFKDR
jgi:hypothetical protein